MEFPLVSVIMPAFQAQATVGEAIRSILAQDYPRWELLVTDDGSSDQTAAIVEDFAFKDARIRLLRQSNGKQASARNHALRHATGSLIAFLDADDGWYPHKLPEQVAALAQTGADAVFADAMVIKNGQEQGLMGSGRGWLEGMQGLQDMLLQNRIPILTVLIRKELIDRVGGFDETPGLQNAEDYHLWLRLLMAGCRFWGMADCLGIYRVHEDNATAQPHHAFWPVCHALMQLWLEAPAENKDMFAKALGGRLIEFLHQVPHTGLQAWHYGFEQLKQLPPSLLPPVARLSVQAALPPRLSRKLFSLCYG